MRPIQGHFFTAVILIVELLEMLVLVQIFFSVPEGGRRDK